MALKYACNCPCAEFEDKKIAGAKLVIGGMISDFKTRVSKNGNEYGVVTIEDFSGSLSHNIFGKTYENFRNKLTVGRFICMKMTVAPDRWNPSKIEPRLEEIQDLDYLMANEANAVSIYLDHRFKTEDFFTGLSAFASGTLSAEDRPGDLFINIVNPETRQVVKVHSRRKFPIGKPLLDFFDDWAIRFQVETV